MVRWFALSTSQSKAAKKKTFQVYTDTNRYQCFYKGCTAGNGDDRLYRKEEGITKHQKVIGEGQDITAGHPVISDAHSDDVGSHQGEGESHAGEASRRWYF